MKTESVTSNVLFYSYRTEGVSSVVHICTIVLHLYVIVACWLLIGAQQMATDMRVTQHTVKETPHRKPL